MIETTPNERRCDHTEEMHELTIPPCCPVSGNPKAGSTVRIHYTPGRFHLEVSSLLEYVNTYDGGKDDVRSMEGMIQRIAQDCADAVRVRVKVVADLVIAPNQKMKLTCRAAPARREAGRT